MEKLYTEVEVLKMQLAEETKERYMLYRRIKELTKELELEKEKKSEKK